MEIKHDIDINVNGWSIIVPTRRSSKNLQYFLKSIELNSHFKHEIIILCDLFTSWQTYKFLQENKLWYYQEALCNYYAMFNSGVNKATREYIVLCQDDTILSKNWDINLNKYLNHKTLLTPRTLQGFEIGHYFGVGPESEKSKIENFDFKAFDDYCQANAKNHTSHNWLGYHPMILAKDTFEKAKGFATFTLKEGQHTQHEAGFKYRLAQLGCSLLGIGNSFSYHAPRTGWDEADEYGYHLYQGYAEGCKDAHYKVKCSKCGIKREGRTLNIEEVKKLEDTLIWLCEKCK